MRIWIAAAALIVLAALGLAATPYVVDWNHYRSDIEAMTESVIGHEITIEGPIAVTLFPRPTLTARDVTMSGKPDAALGYEVASQQVDLGFRPGPLLVGRPIVDQLKMTRPLLTLDQETSDLVVSWPPRLDEWREAFFGADFRLISIIDGRLQLADHQTPDDAAVSQLTLTITSADSQGPMEAVGLFKTPDHRFAIAADVGGQGSDGASTFKLEVDAQNGADEITNLDFNGVLRRRGPDAGLQGRINLNGPDLRNGLKAIAAASGYPSTFLSLAPDQSFRIEGRLTVTEDEIATDQTQITLDEKFGGGQLILRFGDSPRMDLSADLPALTLADDTAFAHFAPIDLLSVFPDTPGRIDLALREIHYRDRTVRRAALKVQTDDDGRAEIEEAKALLPGLVDVRFEGDLRPVETGRRLSGRLTSVGDDLGRTIDWLDLPLANHGEGWRGFSLESDVAIDNVEVLLSAIDMRLDASKVTGSAGLRFSERLKLSLDVDVERLNLDHYTTGGHPAEFASAMGARIDRMDMAIDARFQRLSWKGLRVEEAALIANAEQRRFKLEQLSLQTLGDTRIQVDGEIDLATETVDLSTELSSQVPARLLRHFDIASPLASARLRPLTLTGRTTGMLGGFDVDVEADYDEGRWAIKGQAGWIDRQAHYDLLLTAEHPDHRALASHVGLAPLIPANDAPGAFEISAQLQNDPDDQWLVSGSAKLGPTSITGRLTQEDQTADGMWDARVSIGNPRRDSIAPFLTLIGLRSAANWTPRSVLGRLPRTSFRTGWLDDLDGALSLAAKGGLVGDGLRLKASLKNGFLFVEELEATLWDGEISAEMSLERRRDQPFASLALKLADVDAGALTDWLDMPNALDGSVTVDLDAIAVGRNAAELVRSLSGSMRVTAASGVLQGPKIPDLRRNLRAQVEASLETPPGPMPVLTSPLSMPLHGLDVQATLSRGIATLDDDSVMTFDPGIGDPGGGNGGGARAEASIGGALDLYLWLLELSMAISAEGAPREPLLFGVVGSPEQPQGFFIDADD